MPQFHGLPSRSGPPHAKGVCGGRWVSPGTYIFEMLPPAPLSGPSFSGTAGQRSLPGDRSSPANPRSGDEIFMYILAPPAAFRGKQMGPSRKEMSVRHGWGAGGAVGDGEDGWEVPPSFILSLSGPAPGSRLHLPGVPDPPYLPTLPQSPISSSGETGAHSSAVLHIPRTHPSNQQPPSPWASGVCKGSQVPPMWWTQV